MIRVGNMERINVQRALISVYDKTDLIPFARCLVDQFGIEILSTGGTAKSLLEAGIPVRLVEDVTGFPEMMDGRVKTLHPKIHAGILANRNDPNHMRQLGEQAIEPIDLVVVNLYPFEKTIAAPNCTFEQAVEMIDIGGPCMLRAAAKNHQHVLAIMHKEQFTPCLALLDGTSTEPADSVRQRFAEVVFRETALYDMAVRDYLHNHPPERDHNTPQADPVRGEPLVEPTLLSLRYGENPHQRAFYRSIVSKHQTGVVHPGRLISGSALSFNNYVDATSSWELCAELDRELFGTDAVANGVPGRVVVFVKHTNACGVGVAGEPEEAYRRAYLGDPNAAMGGVLSCGFGITADFAAMVMDTYTRWGKDAGVGGFFVEVWVAPHFDEDAVEMIRTKKNWGQRVRLLSVGDIPGTFDAQRTESRELPGGILEQSSNTVGLREDDWKVVTARAPSQAERADLRLTWLICKHTKSNAITICKDGRLLGNGAGQMSRVMSCRIACWLARENGHADHLAGSSAASDAFFPFPDGPNILIESGVRAIIQPGGSKRDDETIAACDERDTAMILTGTRHFRH